MPLLQSSAIALAYLLTAKLGLLLAFDHTNATAVWPPAGIALAACLLFGYRVWSGVFLGAFLANVLVLATGSSPWSAAVGTAVLTASGNTLTAVGGAYLVRRLIPDGLPFGSARNTVRFILSGALASPLISATIGTVSFSLGGDWTRFPQMWLTWWLGDAVGILVFAPLLLTWQGRGSFLGERERKSEAVILILLLMLIETVVFPLNIPLEYLVFPFLFWAAFRFGQFETAVAVACVMLSFLAWTVGGVGPFAGKTMNHALLFLQSYLGVASASALILSTLVSAGNRADKALRASEEKFRSIFEHAPVGIFQSTVDGRFVSLNGTMAAMFRYSSSGEMLGEVRDIAGLLFAHPDKRGTIISRARDSLDFIREEVTYRRRDGSEFTANLYIRALRDAGGSGAELEGFVEDITERKQAEERLLAYRNNLEEIVRARTAALMHANDQLKREIAERNRTELMLIEQEGQYRDLVESANCVILRWLPDGTIVFFNRFAQQFFGYSREEIINRNIMDTIVPREESTGRWLHSLAAEIVAHPETFANNLNENVRKNGERVWVAWTNKPILSPDGSAKEILSIGIDITKLVKTELELRRTLDDLEIAKERAEAADHLKSAFLATMSHELRTPLNSIIGFTGILLQGLSGPINEEQTKQLTMVKTSANHLLSLISDVLDISKIEAGQLKVGHDPFNLRDSIFKAVQSIRPLAEKKGLQFSCDVAEGVGQVSGDERRLEQVLLNLLSNALKFTDQGSISVTCLREGENYLISVTDTGIGIGSAELDSLFKPFHQIDTGLSRKYEGTGLGLSICRKLVELMGGGIRVESTPGRGSTFSFTIPC